MQRIWPVIAGAILSMPLPLADARAQDPKAWENAVNYMQDDKGCWSIPYGDSQSACSRKQNEVVKWCKESGPFNCDAVDPKQFQREIEQLKTRRDELTSERSRLDRAKSSAGDDRAKSEIDAKLATVDSELNSLSSSRAVRERLVLEASRSCKERLEVAKACRDSRASVQEVFSGVRSRANGETDPKIVPLARRLIAWWDDNFRRHEEQLSGVTRAVQTCERVLYEIGRLGSF